MAVPLSIKKIGVGSLLWVGLVLAISGPVLGESAVVGAPSLYGFSWQWKDETGKSVELSQFRGQSLVITMSYTSCKMSCPLTIRKLKKVRQDLENKSIHAQFIFVTFDPNVDTVHRLSVFKKGWKLPDENSWHFLTGSPESIQQLSQFLGIRFHDDDGHIVHDNKIIIINQAGQIKETLVGWDSDISRAIQN